MSSKPQYRLVSIGAVHHDVIAHAAVDIHRETSTPARFSTRPGGVATNIARAVARLGVETTLIGAVGTDTAALLLQEQLTQEGLRLCLAQRPEFATGQYLALHDQDGGLAAACVDDRILAQAPADLFDLQLDSETEYSSTKTIWFLDANLPEEMLAHLTRRLIGEFVVANAVSNAKAPRLGNVLNRLECLTLNKSEASALLESPPETSAEVMAEELMESGLKSFVLTDGGDRLQVYSEGILQSYNPPSAEVVDVTGAGDAMTAGTIAALARGHTLFEAAQTGMSAAAMTLKTTGAFAEDLSWHNLQIFDQTDKP